MKSTMTMPLMLRTLRLPRDLLAGGEICPVDGVFEVLRADIPAGIDIYDRERLGAVDDEISPARELRPPVRELVHLTVYPEMPENIPELARHALGDGAVVDHDLLGVVEIAVAHYAVDELRFAEHRPAGLRLGVIRLHALPEGDERRYLLRNVLLVRVTGGGTHDEAHAFGTKPRRELFQPAARVLVVYLARYAVHAAPREQHDETPRQRDVGGQPRAFEIMLVLCDLAHDDIAGREPAR